MEFGSWSELPCAKFPVWWVTYSATKNVSLKNPPPQVQAYWLICCSTLQRKVKNDGTLWSKWVLPLIYHNLWPNSVVRWMPSALIDLVAVEDVQHIVCLGTSSAAAGAAVSIAETVKLRARLMGAVTSLVSSASRVCVLPSSGHSCAKLLKATGLLQKSPR